MRRYRWFALGIGVAAAVLVASWLTRRPLTEALIRAYLAEKGVSAAYRVAEADSRHLVFDDVALGPVGNRDLVARRITVDLAWLSLGPQVTAVRLEAPVVRARIRENGVSFGSLDRLIPTTKTIRFPAISTIISNGTVVVATPFGPVVAKVNATGRLDKDFRAVVQSAPAALQSARCSGVVGATTITVTTAIRDFAVSGAGPVSRVVCPTATVPRLQWKFHLAVPITMASFSGDVTIQAPAGKAGAVGFAGLSTLRLEGAGTPGQFRGDWQIGIASPTVARVSAQTVAANGRFLWHRENGVTIGGSLRAAGVASGMAPTAAAGLPDVAATLVKRFAAVSRSVAVDARFTAALGSRIEVTSADIRGAQGSLLHFTGAPGASWARDQANINGTIALSGGGLPTAHIGLYGLALGKVGWTGTGVVIVQPWRAGRAAIAVPGVKFRLADGYADLSGRAVVSTAFGDAQVDGLDLRLAVRTSLDGDHVVFNRGCVDVAATAARIASLTLGRFATRLCPGAANPTLMDKAIAGDIMVGAVKVQGQASGRAFAIDARPARISFGGTLDRPIVRSPGVMLRSRLGDRVGNATIAGMVTGAPSGWTGSGRFLEVGVDLPAVRVRRGAAQWQLGAGALKLAGASALLTDHNPQPRFSPLQVTDAGVDLTAGRINGHGTIRLVDGLAPIATVTGTYHGGKGSAQVDSTLEFSKNLQPLQISELARGYVANVDGKVISHADLEFAAGSVSGTATVRFDAVSLATAALGPVTGIEGTLHFDDLPRLHTPPAQQVKIASINPGVLVEDGNASFQIVDATTIAIETMRWPFTGGTLTLQPVSFRIGDDRRRFVLAVDGLDAGQFLQRFDLKNINATGRFDGVLPLAFVGNAGRIENGLLTARPEGGMIQYVGDVGQDRMGAAARLAFDALRRLRYHSLTLALDGDLDGELVTAISLTGTNAAPVQVGGGLRSSRLPFKFGITVRAPFRALLGTAASFNDARSLLHSAKPDQ